MGQLLNSRPALKSPVAGYHVVAGAFPSSALTPGTILPTVDVERTPGQPDRPVILNVTAPLKVFIPPLLQPCRVLSYVRHCL